MKKATKLLAFLLLGLSSCGSSHEGAAYEEKAMDLKSAVGTYRLYQEVWHWTEHIEDVPLTLQADYSYRLDYHDATIQGTFSLQRIANKEVLFGYETSYPNEESCHIYRISFSSSEAALPEQIKPLFDGTLANQYLYCYVDGKTTQFGASHVIERKSSGGVKVDQDGNFIGAEERTVYIKN